MPVYNGSRYLREAIESILDQTFTDFTLLIIDDASSDNSVEIIKSYHDPRIRIIENQKNLGQAKTMNRGLGFAKGKYIARMDQDDISFPSRLEKQTKYLEKNRDIVLLGSWCKIIDSNSQPIKDFCPPARKNDIINYMVAINNAFAHSSTIFSTNVIQQIGGYPQYSYSQDMALWINIMKRDYPYFIIQEFLVSLRRHENQTMQEPSKYLIRFHEKSAMQFKALINLKPKAQARHDGWSSIKIRHKEFLLQILKEMNLLMFFRYLFLHIMK